MEHEISKSPSQSQKPSPWQRAIVTFDKVLYFFESNIALVCLIVMILTVLYGIVMRFIFRYPNPYGEELSRYMMIYFIYFGVSLNVRFRGHLAVEMIVDYLPQSARSVCNMIADLVSIVFVQNMLQINQNSSQMGIPMWIVYMSMCFGFFFATIRAVLLFWNDYFAKEKILSILEGEEIGGNML